MAYNALLEEKLDLLTPKFGEFTKKKMFGGLNYLYQGNMAFGVMKDDMMLRCAKEATDKLAEDQYIRTFEMRGKKMEGWLLVSPEIWEDADGLEQMMRIGWEYVLTLPAK